MKPLFVPALALMLTLAFACKKDHHNDTPTPPTETKPPVVRKPSVEFISMKVDGILYIDSLTTETYIQKTDDLFSMFEVRGADTVLGKAGKNKGALLYVRINFAEHEIKTGVYGTVTNSIDNAIDWHTYGKNDGIIDYYHASGNLPRHPDAPFRIEVTRADRLFIEGTFSGRAYGTGENGVDEMKEFTEGKFKIARDSVVVLR
ncbi:hypothetical protein ACTJJB_03765 [Chitinophaga sp. 22536]|uniref:hypothetical protein n=1 Tax=unclassified Chitinophaga TaxID=2619133 RepID=UPI003F835778